MRPYKGQGAIESFSGTTAGAKLGQGATEYLVLLAVVLIIALVSVALLGFFPGMASDAQLAQSKAYWQSASPIAIIEWGARDIISSNNNLTVVYMRIRNTGSYPISLTKVLANGDHDRYVDRMVGAGAPVERQGTDCTWRGICIRLIRAFPWPAFKHADLLCFLRG
jgi:hypothetical protein